MSCDSRYERWEMGTGAVREDGTFFGTRARAAAGCNSSFLGGGFRSRPARLLDSVKKRLGLARVNEETGKRIVSKKGESGQGLENAAGECSCWFTGA